MHPWLAVVIGVMLSAAIFLLLQRHLLRQVFGVMILGAGCNLFLLLSGRISRDNLPLVPDGAEALVLPHANPLAQALILTAIVISFGLTAFTLVLVYRAYKATGSADTDDLSQEDDESSD